MCQTSIICGGPGRVTELLWSDRSVFFRVMLFVLTSVSTALFTSTLFHRRNQTMTKWRRPYVGMIPESVPVRRQPVYSSSSSEEGEMFNPQDPNSITCRRCNKTIWLNPGNAIFYLFTVQPWVSYWMIVCDDCHGAHRCYIRDNLKWEYEWCQRNDVGIITEAFPTAEQLAGYEETYELHELSAHDLSRSEESEVAFFHWLLENHDPMEELG